VLFFQKSKSFHLSTLVKSPCLTCQAMLHVSLWLVRPSSVTSQPNAVLIASKLCSSSNSARARSTKAA
jgi:hypothetical protein